MSRIEIHLPPGKANVRKALRCLAGHPYCRKNGFKMADRISQDYEVGFGVGENLVPKNRSVLR